MRITDLPLSSEILLKIEAIEPFNTLNPPQVIAIKSGLLKKKNMVISIPTASGKTFLAELSAIQHILEFKGQVIYLSPLKALATEKFNDFKRFKPLGITVGITVGDFDSADNRLDKYDFLVSTNEKIDSLLRHRKDFIRNVSLIIVDECHLIDDGTRGPTLEALIVKLRILKPSLQILALSATISNAKELADWLNAILVESSWRSVPLKEYYCKQDGEITSRESSSRKINLIENSTTTSLVKETLEQKSQVLIFANSRKRAQNIAKSLINLTNKYTHPNDLKEINEFFSKLKQERNLGDKTSLLLLDLVQNGVAFHHAGLNSVQRGLVENLFKSRLIKIIVATPTLAAGINLPARRVIIANLWRYSSISGRIIPIKIMEYEQMRGRAGRPRYDQFGESFILASTDRDEDLILNKYFSDEGPEKIESKLAVRPTLRIHILGAIATGIVSSYKEVKEFLVQSFFGFQYKDFSQLENILNQVLNDLESFNFILIENESIRVSNLGRRVSQLYIDPVTANILIKGLIESLNFNKLPSLSFLHIYCLVPDITRIRINKKDWGSLDLDYEDKKDILISNEDIIWNYNYQQDIEAFKTALILEEWIKEVPIPIILDKFDLTPGDFQRLQDLVSWISYSAREILKELIHIHQNFKDQFLLYFGDQFITIKILKSLFKNVSGLEIRLSEGIKSDLLELIDIKGLGRVKARTLSNNGIRNRNDLIKFPADQLLEIRGFGPSLIVKIKEQLGISISFDETTIQENLPRKKSLFIRNKPKTLFDYLG